MKKLALLAACAAAAVPVVPLAFGVGTSNWTHTSENDFKAGTFENVVVTNLGDLKLSRAVRTLLRQNPRVSSVNAMVQADDGTIYAGTGPHGQILKIVGDEVSDYATIEGATHVFSLTMDKDGGLLIGTGGETGRVLKIAKPAEAEVKPEEIFKADGVQYVWAVDQGDDGKLYAATGPNGQLFEITAPGESRVLLDADENNLLSLASDGKDLLYVGTDPNGLVYRVNRKTGESFIVYDAPEAEVSALVMDEAGNVYAGTAEARDEPERPQPPQPPQPSGGRPEGAPAGLPIPSKPPTDPEPPKVPDPNPGQPDPIPKTAPMPQTQEPAGDAPDAAGARQAPGDGDAPAGNEPNPDGAPMPDAPAQNEPNPDGAPMPDAPARNEPNPDGAPMPDAPAAGPKEGADKAPAPEVKPGADAPKQTAPGAPGPNPPGGPPQAPPPGLGNPAERMIPGRQPAVDATGKGEPRPEGNAIYRIDADGFVTEVFRQRALVLALAEHDGVLLVATGSEGIVYQVNPAAEETIVLVKVDPKQVTCLLPAQDGNIYMGMANVGGIATIGGSYAATGTYTSPVLDATQISRFGKMHLHGSLPGGTTLTVSTRSGNVKDPTQTSWSKWSDPAPATEFLQVPSQTARFLQYRLTFTSGPDNRATPVVEDVGIAYQVPNLPPQIKSVRLTAQNEPQPPQPPGSDAEPARVPRSPRYQVAWEAADPNGDNLRYTLSFRRGAGSPWITLRENILENQYDWDTRSVADGRYEVRVTATDARANPPGKGRTSSRVSDPVLVDNTAPVVGSLRPQQNGAAVQVNLKVVDRSSIVAGLDYSVNSTKGWQAVLPSDNIFDSPEEAVSFDVPGLPAGNHQITVRATDAKGNQAFESVFVTVESPAVDASR